MKTTALFTAIAAFSISSLHAADFIVNNADPSDLVGAINSASSGDRVVFNSSLDGATIQLTGQIVIAKNIAIDASSLPNGITISGDVDGSGTPTTGDSRTFVVTSGHTVTMNNLTLTGGHTPKGASGASGSSSLNGGGLYNSGTLTMTRCRVQNNSTGDGGDGVGGYGGNAGFGGGIFNGGTLTLIECSVTNNRTGNGGDTSLTAIATGGFGGPGGALYNNPNGVLTIISSTFSDNQSGNGGSNSGPNGSAGRGGDGGGIYLASGSTATIRNSTFSGNSTGSNGTATGTGDPSRPGYGGGVFVNNANIELTNCTIFQNSIGAGEPAGGGGLTLLGPNGNAIIENTVIAGNQVNAGQFNADIHSAGNLPTTANGVNLIGDNASVETLFPLPNQVGEQNANGDFVGDTANPFDPLLGALANNGGVTETHLPAASSPLVDPLGGSATSTLSSDQRGLPRVSYFILDIGAVEIQTPPPAAPKITTKRRVVTKRKRAVLRGTVTSDYFSNLTAKASGRAKAKLQMRGDNSFKTVVKRLKRRTTRVKFTATDEFGQTSQSKVKVIKKKKK